MTAIFDEAARERVTSNVLRLPQKGENISVKDITVKPLSKDMGREYIAMFHYSQTFPDSTLFCFGAFFGDVIQGVICYGMGCGKNQYTAIIPNIKNGQYIELTRLWCSDYAPKNIESYLISKSLKMLPQNIKLVVSFSDEMQGHIGIIYQAANFYYLGKNNGGKMLEMENGIKKHPRLLGIYRMRHKEYAEYSNKQLMELLNLREVEGGAKHRYVYLRGSKVERKKMYRIIKDKIQEYPKGDVKKPDYNEDTLMQEQIEKQGFRQMSIYDFLG